jgi:hypothetical protein
MPHKPSPKSPSDVTFVSCSLTEEQKPKLRAWADRNESDLMLHIAALVSGGYRISLKEDAKRGYSANMAQTRENGPNKGRILQEWGSSPQRSLLKLLWAHLEYFELQWPEGNPIPTDDW